MWEVVGSDSFIFMLISCWISMSFHEDDFFSYTTWSFTTKKMLTSLWPYSSRHFWQDAFLWSTWRFLRVIAILLLSSLSAAYCAESSLFGVRWSTRLASSPSIEEIFCRRTTGFLLLCRMLEPSFVKVILLAWSFPLGFFFLYWCRSGSKDSLWYQLKAKYVVPMSTSVCGWSTYTKYVYESCFRGNEQTWVK